MAGRPKHGVGPRQLVLVICGELWGGGCSSSSRYRENNRKVEQGLTAGGGGMSRRGGPGHIEGGLSVCVRLWLGLGHVKGVRDTWLRCGVPMVWMKPTQCG